MTAQTIETRKCRYCGQTFTPPKPTTTLCQFCYYEGRHHAETHAALIARLTAIPSVDRIEIRHTGGGCFGMAVLMKNGYFLFATADGDAVLPDPGELWMVSINETEDLFIDGSDEPYTVLEGITDDEFVNAVAKVQEHTR